MCIRDSLKWVSLEMQNSKLIEFLAVQQIGPHGVAHVIHDEYMDSYVWNGDLVDWIIWSQNLSLGTNKPEELQLHSSQHLLPLE